jgi:hypothetical protein
MVAVTALSLACGGCRDFPKTKKPDPSKGKVTGIVICADTGKPARFAYVTLSAYPKKDDSPDNDKPLPETETAETGLDGRFRFEAVEPGRYFAFATLEGYLDPKVVIDLTRLGEKATGQERILDAIEQWKDHLTEVTVTAHLSADLTLQVERAAEIDGTVTYDDGSPAIGVYPQLFRRNVKKAWIPAGISNAKGSSLVPATDGHGRYSLTNLSPGEYTVCTMLPSPSDDVATSVCQGNVFRLKNAVPVKVQTGEISRGNDIAIPLGGLHAVAGRVTALADGHVPDHATIRLLYADDREIVHEIKSLDDGSFSFPYVPEGKYILQLADAGDPEKQITIVNSDGSAETKSEPGSARTYADQEIPIEVRDDLNDLQIALVAVTPIPPAQPVGP